MARFRRRDKLAIATIVLVCAMAANAPVVDYVSGLSLDLLTTLRWHAFGPRSDPADSATVVVAIDEATYDTAPFKDSPTVIWTTEIGRVLSALVEADAAVVGFDLVFPTSIEQSAMPFGDATVGSRLRGFDRAFLRALHRAAAGGQIVLGEIQLRDQPIQPSAGQRFAVGRRANIRALNAHTDADGVVRRMPLRFQAGETALPSMAVELAARALGSRPAYTDDGSLVLAGYRVPSAIAGTMTLNFDGGAADIPTYSLADLRECAARGDTDYFRRQFAGKVVLLGTLLDIADRKLTSKRFTTGIERAAAPRCALPPRAAGGQIRRATLSGVYIHATAVNNLIGRDALSELARPARTAIAFGLATAAAAAALLLAPAAAALAWLGVGIVYAALALAVFGGGLALPLIEPLLAGLVALAATIGYRVVVADKDERLLRRSFSMYLAPQVIDAMVESDRLPTLGGETRQVTILFSDIAGFSSFSQTLSPQALVALMNEYLSAMTDIIENAGGYVDKYVGDSIVAVFGAPRADAEHARHAVEAALRCQARLDAMNRSGDAFGGLPIAHRIGIHSGLALLGNIGSRRRFNYTVMGDAVNLASRLEGANRYFATSIMASQHCVELTADAFTWREIDAIRVKGISQPVRVFEPLAPAGQQTGSQASIASLYATGLAAWRQRDFAGAADRFAEIAAIDAPAALFEQRARALVDAPPAADWQPVQTLEGK